MKLQERYRGALLGLAAGDALGTTNEFKKPGSFKPISDMNGGGTFNLKAGEWTDDTSMALCLATSLVEQRGFDATDQMERYARWHADGYLSSNGRCFDIGNACRAAIYEFEQTDNPYAGSVNAAGNGSIMRLCPVVLFYARDPREAIEYVAWSSLTTHAHPVAVDACRYLAALIAGALQGFDKETLLSERYSPVAGLWDETPLHPEIDEIACGSFKSCTPEGRGYAAKSLEAALWAFYHSNSFEEGALLAANLGDDADTTAAVYGQLAGAYYGEDGIPQSWREKLAYRWLIAGLADDLYRERERN